MPQLTVDQALFLAQQHHQSGLLAEAESLYRRILAQSPDHPGALHLLGLLACQRGYLAEAIDLITRSLALAPNVAEAHCNLAESYRRSGKLAEAIAALQTALALNPALVEAHRKLGDLFLAVGRWDDAIAAYGEALARAHPPDDAEVFSNLGLALTEKQGRLEDAIAACQRAIALRPGLAAAHCNLGRALHAQGRTDEAIAAYRRAVALDPGLALAHANLANVLQERGELDEAVVAIDRALALRPDLAPAHNSLGCVRLVQGDRDAAIAAFGRAVALDPGLAEARLNLANTLREVGRLDEALAGYRQVLAAKPDLEEAASTFLATLHYHPGFDAQAILAEHRRWAQRHAALVTASGSPSPHPNDRTPDRPLRIGLVSPDFRGHPVGQMLLALFRHHDRRQTALFAYSGVRKPDRLTAELRALADSWQDTTSLADAELADRIRADRIDILVDLAVHTAGNRLLVFARRPAPVQLTMMGMPATTGLAAIDYRLTDRYLDPPGAGAGATDGDYVEQSVRLPHCFWVFVPPEEEEAVPVPVGPLPAGRNGFVTFGCLNHLAKVSQPAQELWARVLSRVPGSRLVMLAPPGRHRDTIRERFQQAGVAGERITFLPQAARRAYYLRFQDIDLGLDPFPYNGHTSTLDALWMGVPVVTLAGKTAVGRGGVSILSNLGLPELIAATPDEYADIAVRWAGAGERDRLAALRATLRPKLERSPLMDAPRYAADIEAAWRKMWRAWCGA